MKTPLKTSIGRKAWLRGLAGFAGMAVACTLLAAVTILFGQAGDMPWLPETPSNVAAMQRCDGVHGTAARRACAEQVVAAVLAHDNAAQVAHSEPEAHSRSPRQ
jgi:hypothetical protein